MPACLIVLAAVAAGPAVAQEAALPAARALVDRHVEQTRAARLVELGALRTVSDFAMSTLGMSGEIVVAGKAPNRAVLRMTLPGLGEIASGFDGETGWSMNPMEGPRLLAGEELAQIRDEAHFGANTRSPELVASMQTVEQTEVGGKACWKVRLVWKSGRETFDCYSVESGYLVATMMTTQTVMGPVDSVITFDEYTDFDGVVLPRVSTQQAFGQEMIVTLKSVEFGGIDASAFELPQAIRALVGK